MRYRGERGMIQCRGNSRYGSGRFHHMSKFNIGIYHYLKLTFPLASLACSHADVICTSYTSLRLRPCLIQRHVVFEPDKVLQVSLNDFSVITECSICSNSFYLSPARFEGWEICILDKLDPETPHYVSVLLEVLHVAIVFFQFFDNLPGYADT